MEINISSSLNVHMHSIFFIWLFHITNQKSNLTLIGMGGKVASYVESNQVTGVQHQRKLNSNLLDKDSIKWWFEK